MVMPLNIPSIGKFSDEELITLCLPNPDLNIERDEKGQILINMSPTYALTSSFNSSLIFEIFNWNKKTKAGKVFDSNSGFFLPDSSMKGRDVAWVAIGRWDNLSMAEKKSIPKLVPDFIIELQSENDNISELKNKMGKWMENGVKLAWLVSPQSQETMVYFDNTIENVPFKNKLDGKNVLVDLELIMSEILEA